MKKLNTEHKGQIVNYIMSNLSRKQVKLSDFAEACGFSVTYLYMIKGSVSKSKVPEKLWDYLYQVYKENQFDAIMKGEGPRYDKQRQKPAGENGGKVVDHTKSKKDLSSIDEAIVLLNRACKAKGVSCKVILEAV